MLLQESLCFCHSWNFLWLCKKYFEGISKSRKGSENFIMRSFFAVILFQIVVTNSLPQKAHVEYFGDKIEVVDISGKESY